LFVKLSIVNFKITDIGLEDQMKSQIVFIEKYDLESEKSRLIEITASNEKALLKYENEILDDLRTSDPIKILEDDEMINKLANTKDESNRIKTDNEITKKRDQEIELERNI